MLDWFRIRTSERPADQLASLKYLGVDKLIASITSATRLGHKAALLVPGGLSQIEAKLAVASTDSPTLMLKTFQLKPMMENRIDSSKGEEARMMHLCLLKIQSEPKFESVRRSNIVCRDRMELATIEIAPDCHPGTMGRLQEMRG